MVRGFYSVVQYCPDRFRSEAVNVGLIMFCEDPHTVRVRMTNNHVRVRKFFGVAGPELKNFKLSTHNFKSRVEANSPHMRTLEDLATFAASRANDLRLTEPRLMKLQDVDMDFDRLFAQLVEDHSTESLAKESPTEVLPPALSTLFYRLQGEHKIWRPGTITVPIYRRRITIPYAYQNGVINLVKPCFFASTKRAETQAAELAVNGDLISKHPENGEQRRLIVVSTRETPEQAKEIREHVEPLFKEYRVRLIRPADAEGFAQEVEASAH